MHKIITVRIKEELYDLLKKSAKEQERSRNWTIVKAIREYLKGYFNAG